MTKININADMGESFGAYKLGDDVRLAGAVQSANIACGFHGGDPLIIQNCISTCLDQAVSLGAHPSFYDLQGFGRREMSLSSKELETILIYQIGALQGLAQSLGSQIKHVKPHGAMNNMACRDLGMATVIAKTIRTIDQDLILLAPALSCLSRAGKENGLNVVEELYADRAYEDDGQLVSRKKAGAVLHDPKDVFEHVSKMLTEQALISQSGKKLPCQIQSICVHGDNPQSCQTAEILNKKLSAQGFDLMPITAL